MDPSWLVPPSIPNTLGAEDINKVIASLTNVRDVSLPSGVLDGGARRSQKEAAQQPRRRRGEGRESRESRDRGSRGRGGGAGRGAIAALRTRPTAVQRRGNVI